MSENILAQFGSAFTPKSIRPHLRGYLGKAGFHGEPYTFLGVIFLVSMIFSALTYVIFVSPQFIGMNALLVGILAFVSFSLISFFYLGVFAGFAYLYLDFKVFTRVRQIEEILPEFLQLVSTNVKSGLSFEYALWYSMRPKFGILTTEMQFVLKKVMTGHELGDALEEFAAKYNSPALSRTIHLIIGELDSGGKISHILDSVVTNLKNNQKMRAEMSASAVTYIIFIGAVVIVISPALFALSFNLLAFIQEFVTKLAATGGADQAPFKINPESMNLDEFRIFSAVAVSLIGVLSSMIVAVIEKGDVRAGLKYIPVFLIGSAICYFLASVILESIFGGITF